MEIKLPETAAREGILRIWLRRIPVESGMILAMRRAEAGEPAQCIGQAGLFGRGEGSPAAENVMLLFRLSPGDGLPLTAGEPLDLLLDDQREGPPVGISLDILSVE